MTGSLQEKNGKFYAVINIPNKNGHRKQKWISTGLDIKGNKKNAEKFLRDKLKELEQQENIITTDVLFYEYILSWLELVKMKIEESTYQSYKCIANAHIIPYFKEQNIKLNNLTRNHLQQYINSKYEPKNGQKGLSAKTIKSHLVIINQALTEAVKTNLIQTNPCDYVVIPKIKKYEASFYTAQQINCLLSATKNEPIFPLIYITAVYGLRRSEVLGLKWDSINFNTNTLTIKHTVVDIAKRIEKDSTKNKSSYRSFPINDEVKNLLLSLKEKENLNKQIFGNKYLQNDYIFKWDNGKPYNPDYISRTFNKILKKFNLPIIRFHDLRHSCASLLVAQGFTIKDIQEWLGHADIQTTANIYAHLDIERKSNIMHTMTDILTL